MKSHALATLLCLFALTAPVAWAQLPVTADENHEHLLASTDPTEAANKRLVYDFFREVLEGGHLELADTYLTEDYQQHNPNVPSGRAGFVEFFQTFTRPKPIQARVGAPIVSIVAEGDLVVFAFARKVAPPGDPTLEYTTTWFDMFRIENGKIAEHWDGATKR